MLRKPKKLKTLIKNLFVSIIVHDISVGAAELRRTLGGVEKLKFHTEVRIGPACKF